MENVHTEQTDTSPAVDFDFAANTFSLKGMSFMEDVTGFYDPLMEIIEQHLGGLENTVVQFDFALNYFNSSSARVVLALFDLLDATAARGNTVDVRWMHEGDEDMIEQGEEFGEDLEHARFSIIDMPETA